MSYYFVLETNECLSKASSPMNVTVFPPDRSSNSRMLLDGQGTVEERMEAVQARKQRLISGALTDQEVRTARIEELKMLFT